MRRYSVVLGDFLAYSVGVWPGIKNPRELELVIEFSILAYDFSMVFRVNR